MDIIERSTHLNFAIMHLDQAYEHLEATGIIASHLCSLSDRLRKTLSEAIILRDKCCVT